MRLPRKFMPNPFHGVALRSAARVTKLRLSPESAVALDERLKSRDGQKSIHDFARLIAAWAIDQMTPETREVFGTPEGIEEFSKMWPEIVDAFFRSLSGPTPSRKRKASGKASKRAKPFSDSNHEAERTRLIDAHETALERLRSADSSSATVDAAEELNESLRRLQEFISRPIAMTSSP
jgi:hypothetical protein